MYIFRATPSAAGPFWHSGRPFWHLGSTPGGYFGTSGTRWRAVGAAGWTRDGSLQDFIDFVVILGPVYISDLSSKTLKFHCVSGFFPSHLFIDFWIETSTFGTSESRLSHGRYRKNRLFTKIVFNDFWDRLLSFLRCFGDRISDFLGLVNRFKNREIFWWCNRSWVRDLGTLIYSVFGPSKDVKHGLIAE